MGWAGSPVSVTSPQPPPGVGRLGVVLGVLKSLLDFVMPASPWRGRFIVGFPDWVECSSHFPVAEGDTLLPT